MKLQNHRRDMIGLESPSGHYVMSALKESSSEHKDLERKVLEKRYQNEIFFLPQSLQIRQLLDL